MIRDTGGQSLTEYAMIIALIAIGAVMVLSVMGHHITDHLSCMVQAFDGHACSV